MPGCVAGRTVVSIFKADEFMALTVTFSPEFGGWPLASQKRLR